MEPNEMQGLSSKMTGASHIQRITPAENGVASTSPATPLPCRTCGGDSGSAQYVYAIGRIEVRVPKLSVEKEFAQATGRTETTGQTDQQAFHNVLSQRENVYLARQLCWVLTVQGLETYLLQPRHTAEYDRL